MYSCVRMIGLAFLGSSCLTPAAAAENGAVALGFETADAGNTIVVTARRRDETLLETPTTLSAVEGRTLNNLRVNAIQSVIALTPNTVIQRDPENFNTYINIRGIRQADINAEPNFGLYRNGIFYGGQRSNLGALVDVARVEVLRGPQAGLYGRNAVGGAVNILYATPAGEPGGYAALGYGRYGRLELQSAVNLPVGEGVALRAAGWLFNQNRGEFYNVTLGREIDHGRDSGLRLTARAVPRDDLEIIWAAEYERSSGPSRRAYAPDGVANSIVGAPIVSDPEAPGTLQRNVDGRTRFRQYYLSQTVNYATSIGRFTLLASYRDYALTGVQDADGTALAPRDGPGVLDQALRRQEGIASGYIEALWTSREDVEPLRWTAGASWFDETFDVTRTVQTSLDLGPFGIPAGVVTGFTGQPLPGSRIKTRAWSGFAELGYRLAPSLTLTGTLRYTDDRKRLAYAQGLLPFNPETDPIVAMLFGAVLPRFSLERTSTVSNWSPSLNLSYAFGPSAQAYAIYSTGFRAGGFNVTTTSPALIPYGQERARNYEIGVKGNWLGKLSASLALFHMTQSDLVLAQDDPADAVFGFTYLTNIGNARTWGAELEIEARPAPWLSAAFSVGYLDAEFTSGSSFGVSVVGDPIPYTRSWTINGLLNAAYPVTGRTRLVGTANWRIETGGVLDQGANYEDLNRLDLTAGIEHGGMRLVGYVTNLFEDRVVEFRYRNGLQSLSLGRRFGVEARLHF